MALGERAARHGRLSPEQSGKTEQKTQDDGAENVSAGERPPAHLHPHIHQFNFILTVPTAPSSSHPPVHSTLTVPTLPSNSHPPVQLHPQPTSSLHPHSPHFTTILTATTSPPLSHSPVHLQHLTLTERMVVGQSSGCFTSSLS